MNHNTFALTLKHFVVTNKKMLLLTLVSALGLSVLSGSFLGYYHMGGGFKEVFLFLFMFEFASAVMGSLMFADMKTKEGRISLLMLPSTAWDKFASRWLVLVPAFALFLLGCFYVGDLSRLVTYQMTSHTLSSAYARLVNPFAILGYIAKDQAFLVGLLSVMCYLLGQAWFVFGSILWPKLSFIKTLAALWVVEFVTAFFIGSVFDKWLLSGFKWMTVTGALWTALGVATALTTALYAATYYRLKKTQVTSVLF